MQEYFMNQVRLVDTELFFFNFPVFYATSDELHTS